MHRNHYIELKNRSSSSFYHLKVRNAWKINS